MSIKCKVCDVGELKPRKRYRMSGIVVLLGWLFLVPSILGMLIGVLFIASTGKAMNDVEVKPHLSEQLEKQLIDAGVSGDLIGKIKENKPLTATDTSSLTEQQKSLVSNAASMVSLGVSAQNVGKGAAGVFGFGAGLFFIVISFMGGLLGWLLTMKKKVLQCTSCEAVVAAG